MKAGFLAFCFVLVLLVFMLIVKYSVEKGASNETTQQANASQQGQIEKDDATDPGTTNK